MKNCKTTMMWVLVLSFTAGSTTVIADDKKPENSIEARYAYTMGYRIGQMLKSQGVNQLDNKNFTQGMTDVFKAISPRLDEIEMNDAVVSYQAHVKRQRKLDPNYNRTQGTSFLAENKARPGVIETESGLQYEIIKASGGEKPQLKNKVVVHYHGTLINGDVFDSSVARGEPVEFSLKGVIPGFREALLDMQVGEKRRIFIPPQLAYGKQGVHGKIGPDETLVFEMELLDIR